MAGQEDSESKRLLKPGDFDLRAALPLTGFFSAAEVSDSILYKPSTIHGNASLYQPARSLTPIEPYSHFYHRPENHTFMPFSDQANSISQQADLSVPSMAAEKRLFFKSESATTISSLYSRQGPIHSASQPFEISNPSSPESEDCLSFRTAADRQIMRTIPIYPRNSTSTQTERSPFEEKFLFRESILLGCDLVAELTDKLPALAGLREHAQFVREKTIQSRAQNVCSRLVHKAKEPQIIAEYVKTFFRIADSWLDVRNCFGISDQCSNETCSLDTKDLTNNYVEWMHVSRHLLNSIVKGLETVSKDKTTELTTSWSANESSSRMVGAKGVDPANWPPPIRTMSDVSGAGGVWGHPPNPPCYCAPPGPPPTDEVQQRAPPARNYNQNDPTPRFQFQPPMLYPNQPRMYPVNDTITDASDEYLKPSSYDVPRTHMPTSQKRNNISKAKSTCFQDRAANRGYVIALVSGSKREGFDGKDCNDLSENEEGTKSAETESLNGGTVDEWMIPLLKDVEPDEDCCLDSDSQGSAKDLKSETNDNQVNGSDLNRLQKFLKTSVRHVKRRLTHNDLILIQAIVQELWKCDIPDHMKHPVKNAQQYYKVVRHPIFLETITNKVKNGIYETLEQFVHDGRRLVSNAFLFCKKDNLEIEKASKFGKKLESLMEESFQKYPNWNHITGDPKEVNNYPDLKSTNAARKRYKLPKNVQATEFKP